MLNNTFARCGLRVACTLRFAQEGPEQEMIDGAGEEEEIAACDQWVLPSAGLEGVRWTIILGVRGSKLAVKSRDARSRRFEFERNSGITARWAMVEIATQEPLPPRLAAIYVKIRGLQHLDRGVCIYCRDSLLPNSLEVVCCQIFQEP